MFRLENANKKCTLCKLGKGRAVFGQSECNASEVHLVVVSAFPGNSEVQQDKSLAPQSAESKRLGKPMGAGEFLRLSFKALFDRDPNFPEELKPFENFVFFTNAVKCNPQHGKEKLNVTPAMIKKCKEEWLLPEIREFDPKVPILLAAGEAVKSILGTDYSLQTSRRKVHYVNEHPVVVTINPIEAERGLIKELKNPEAVIEDLEKLFLRVKNPGKKVSHLMSSYYWKTEEGSPLFGSVPWHWQRDLFLLKEQVINYWNNAQ
jgi:uracil-DNA glycosylase